MKSATFASDYAVIQDLISRQKADAESRLSNPSYWGQTGMMVHLAANSCERVANANIDRASGQIHFDRMSQALDFVQRHFTAEYGDEDGYGGATFAEVKRALATCPGFHSSPKAPQPTKFSDAFGTYAATTPEWAGYADGLLSESYDRCLSTAQLILERSRIPDFQRMGIRMAIVIFERVGDSAESRRWLDVAKEVTYGLSEPYDDLFDALATGKASVAKDCQNFAPIVKSKAEFWEGTFRKSRGDRSGLTLLANSTRSDWGLESAYASSDLGIPWIARQTESELANVLRQSGF